MIQARRIEVGTDPVDLTAGSGTSGVGVQWVRNSARSVLFVGGTEDATEDGIPLGRGEVLPALALGATDSLHVARKSGSGPVDVVLGWA